MTACKMMETHRFIVSDIHENYETYLMKKDQAAEV